jgi:hypothetical protein
MRTDDPAQVSDETLASFEADGGSTARTSTAEPTRRPAGSQGLFLLLGMIVCIAVGTVTVFTWFL